MRVELSRFRSARFFLPFQECSTELCAAVESDHTNEVTAANERAREYAQELDEANERVATLQQEMARVCGREEALKGVIERMIERYGMWLAYEPRV